MGELSTACSYSIGGGKLLRPVLALAVGEAVNIELAKLRPFASAVECIHAFSLVHDDLPLMDNDSLRRGKPTTHVQFGAAPALLVGDALLARAFGLLVDQTNGNPEVAVNLCRLIAQTTIDLCRGQLLDLQAGTQSSADAEESLALRHSLKTGALIVAAVVGPLELLSAKERTRWQEPIAAYGRELGLLFQITDDILDVISSDESLGKEAGADKRQGTTTYTTVFGVEGARRLASEAASRARSALEGTPAAKGFLGELVGSVLARKR